jgi:hypothetical protein
MMNSLIKTSLWIIAIIVLAAVGYVNRPLWNEQEVCARHESVFELGENYNCNLNACEKFDDKWGLGMTRCFCPATNDTVYLYCSQKTTMEATRKNAEDVRDYLARKHNIDGQR